MRQQLQALQANAQAQLNATIAAANDVLVTDALLGAATAAERLAIYNALVDTAVDVNTLVNGAGAAPAGAANPGAPTTVEIQAYRAALAAQAAQALHVPAADAANISQITGHNGVLAAENAAILTRTAAQTSKQNIITSLSAITQEGVESLVLLAGQAQLDAIYVQIDAAANAIADITNIAAVGVGVGVHPHPTPAELMARRDVVLNEAAAPVRAVGLTQGHVDALGVACTNLNTACSELDSANAKIIKKPIIQYLSQSYGLSGVKDLSKSGNKYTITFTSPKSREDFALMFNEHGSDLTLRKNVIVCDTRGASLGEYLGGKAKAGRYSAKFDRQNLAYQNKVLDEERTPFISKAVRFTAGGFGIVPSVFTAVGRTFAYAHNNMGVRHIPIVGALTSLLATSFMRASNLFDSGMYSKANEQNIEEVIRKQKKAQDPRNKTGIWKSCAHACKFFSAPFAAFGAVSLVGRSIGDGVKTFGDGIINVTKKIPIIGALFGVQGVGGLIRESGRLISATANVFDVQHVGRSEVIGKLFDDQVQKGVHKAEKRSREFGENPLKPINKKPTTLDIPPQNQADKISSILFDSNKCAFAIIGEYDLGHGLRAIEVLRWDKEGKFEGLEKQYVNGKMVLTESQVDPAQKVDLETLDYKQLSNKSLSIGDYQKIMNGKAKQLFAEVKTDSTMKIDGTDYEVKKNGQAIEFYRHNTGVKMQLLDSKTVDIDFFQVLQKLQAKELSLVPISSPRPSPSGLISATPLNQQQSRQL